jgi:hypothetical protein
MTQQEADALAGALRQRFGGEVEAQPVNGNGRYRFAVVSPQFHAMNHLQRQDAVWAVADATLARQASLDVSLILAFDPTELAETGEPS